MQFPYGLKPVRVSLPKEMKYRIMNILRCPYCHSKLNLDVLKEIKIRRKNKYFNKKNCKKCYFTKKRDCNECFKKEIIKGYLTCRDCKERFIIKEGIPKMLVRNSQDELKQEKITKFFDVQWSYFGKLKRVFAMDENQSMNYLMWTLVPKDFDKKDFDNKTILDAGCGVGNYIKALSKRKSEVIGLDITSSLDLLNSDLKELSNLHLIQGDILNPPFKYKIFDLVFSIGVIHHTPDPKKAFKSLSRVVKKNGLYSLWIYPCRPNLLGNISKILRMITIKLPKKALYLLSYMLVPTLYFIKPYNNYIKPNLSNTSWEECAQILFDFYGPIYQKHYKLREIKEWFIEEGYKHIEFGMSPLSVVALKGPNKS